MSDNGRLQITWVKSGIGYSYKQKATLRALGLHRMWESVEQTDGPVVRGMLYRVQHLVQVKELSGENA
jgi:large subunit ribosomal protein L30